VDAFGELAKSDENTQAWIKRNCSVFGNAGDALMQFAPDFVSVCVPNFVKNDTALELSIIEKRIPLMISKLRLRDKSDFDVLLDAAVEFNSDVYIGEFYRYIPCVQAVKTIIESGEIGEPEQMRYECGLPYSDISPWEIQYKNLALEDLAFHHFSVIHYLIDITPDIVSGESYTPKKGERIGGTVSSALITTKKGCHISHLIDWHNTMRKTDFLGDFYIDGSKGGVSVKDGRVYVMKWGGALREVPVPAAIETTAPEKVLAGKMEQLWPISAFKPVIDCIYRAIG
jgi:predicted dehydrogenase